MKNTLLNQHTASDSNRTNIAQDSANTDVTITKDHGLQRPLDIAISAAVLGVASPLILARLGINLVKGQALVESHSVKGRGLKSFNLLSIVNGNRDNRLAQLINVLRGDMSLVGPRPLTSVEAREVPEQYANRFTVRPGLFSPHMLRKSTGIDYNDEWSSDCEFVKNMCMKAYLGLVFRTLLARAMGIKADKKIDDSLKIFGVEITNTSMEEAVEWILERVQEEEPVNIGFANADCLNQAHKNDAYYTTLRSFDRVLADGIGVRIAAKMNKSPLQANVNGTDMFPILCEALAQTDSSIFLLGARPEIAAAAADNMQQRYPNLNVAGTHHGYFESAEHEDAVIEQINNSGASVLMVAMGSPNQELWIAKNSARLTPKVRIGVGGLFDFYSGRIARAPMWVREVGMEWVWRLMQEPGRMWQRYVIGNPLFLLRAWMDCKTNEKLSTTGRCGKRSILQHFTKLNQGASVFRLRARMMRWAWSTSVSTPRNVKRLFDVTCSGIMLLLLAPLFTFVAILIKLDSEGSILFSQTRIGENGKPFRFWKFRSMCIDSEAKRAEMQADKEVLFKMKQDPRVTRIGKLIRKYSIDELPQLWNIFKGEMSFVGPRPCLPSEVAQYSLHELKRLEAIPGLTCYWQISGRSELSFDEQVELDLKYLYSRSLIEDIKILCKTVPAVVSGHGAY